MRRTSAAFLILTGGLAAMGPLPAAGEDVMTAGDLQGLCHASDTTSRNVCRVYLLGVTEGIALGIDIGHGQGAPACLPAGVSGDDLQARLRERLDADLSQTADAAQAPAARVIARLMAKAYPCRPLGR